MTARMMPRARPRAAELIVLASLLAACVAPPPAENLYEPYAAAASNGPTAPPAGYAAGIAGRANVTIGLHDFGGEHLQDAANASGWTVHHQPLNGGPKTPLVFKRDFSEATSRGIRVIVRIDNSWQAGKGTISCRADYDRFAQEAASYVSSTQGVSRWVIGNELNIDDQYNSWPICNGVVERTTPGAYAEAFKKVRDAIRAVRPGDQVLLAAVAPHVYSTENGGVEHGADYQARVIAALGAGNFDGIAMHSYTERHDTSLVASEARDPRAAGQYSQFRSYRSQIQALPPAAASVPVYITEAGPWPSSWANENRGWMQAATRDVLDWNSRGNHRVESLVFYRWMIHDAGSIETLRNVQDDYLAALAIESGSAAPATPPPSAGAPPRAGWWMSSSRVAYYYNGSGYCRAASNAEANPLQGTHEPPVRVDQMSPCGGTSAGGPTWQLSQDCRPNQCAPRDCTTPAFSDPNVNSTGVACSVPGKVCNTPGGSRSFVCR
jgi:hypothetical protein